MGKHITVENKLTQISDDLGIEKPKNSALIEKFKMTFTASG